MGHYEICWKKNKIRRATVGKNTFVGRLLRTSIDRWGYIRTHVKVDGKHYALFHQVVALAYHGPCPRGKEVNHRDGNKQNNDPENLEYRTHRKNIAHAKMFGLVARNYGAKNGKAKLTDKIVNSIRKFGTVGHWTQVKLAEKYKISQSTVSFILRSKTWQRNSQSEKYPYRP